MINVVVGKIREAVDRVLTVFVLILSRLRHLN